MGARLFTDKLQKALFTILVMVATGIFGALPGGIAAQAQQQDTEVPVQEEGEGETETGNTASQGTSPTATTPEAQNKSPVLTDLEALPFPVRKMRELILEAARAGDVEKLRRYIGYGDDVTMLSLGGHDEDPIEFLKSLSGDNDGHEILAIMSEILEAPYTIIRQTDGEEVYVWPYFYTYPFEELTPEQRVNLFRIITYGDYEEMVSFGSYIFYRLGISPEGRWRFFVAGD